MSTLIPIMMMPMINKLIMYNLHLIDLISHSDYTCIDNLQKIALLIKKQLNDDFSSFKRASILLIPLFLNNFFIMFNTKLLSIDS
jgi:hypothetical protein